MSEKTCPGCEQTLPRGSFSKDISRWDGLSCRCKKCRVRATRESSRRFHLKRAYGISLEQFNQLKAFQKERCAICGDVFGENCYVDHCHTTGAVRGLLCPSCNSGLGLFSDNLSRLKKAANYLQCPPLATLTAAIQILLAAPDPHTRYFSDPVIMDAAEANSQH